MITAKTKVAEKRLEFQVLFIRWLFLMIDWCFFQKMEIHCISLVGHIFGFGDTFESASWETLIVTDMPYCDNMWQFVLEWFKIHEVPPHWLWKNILRPKKVGSCSDVKLYLYKWFENPLCASLKKKKKNRRHTIQISWFLSCVCGEEQNETTHNGIVCSHRVMTNDICSPSCSGLIVHLQQRLQLISNTPTLISPV